MPCELCDSEGGEVLWRDEGCRVILAQEPDYPGLCRIIWNRHVKEMSDLSEAEQARLMRVVLKVERAVRHALAPDKINLASLGNYVPHLHWHVIPRFENDRHFPAAIWSEPRRGPSGVYPPGWKNALVAALAVEST